MRDLDDILELPDDKIRKLKHGQRRGRYKRHPRPRFSREQLVEYLKKRGFKTARQLEAGRAEGEPKVYDYIREFGSWGTARNFVFGHPELEPEIDVAYVLKGIVEFGLWTASKYRAARKMRPDVFPSMHRVVKRWGSFGQMTRLALRLSMKQTLKAYILLWRKLGRTPTLKECKQNGLVIKGLIDFFDGKRAFDEYVAGMEKLT
jgi:hypothetical protein